MELQELLQDVQSEADAEAAKATEARSEDERTDADAKTPQGDDSDGKPEDEKNPEGDDEAKGDDDEDEDESGDDKPRRESRSARLRRQNAALRAELEALKRSPQADAGKPDAAKGDADPAPKFDDYEGDWDRYDADRIKWAARQAIRDDRAAQERTRTAEQQAERRRELVLDFQDALASARKAIPDFDEVVGKAASVKVAPHVEDLLLESEKSALLQYHLAQKPALLEELNALPEREAARRIGRLEARLSLPAPKKATQAPAPVTAPKGGASPSNPDAEIDAFIARKYGRR